MRKNRRYAAPSSKKHPILWMLTGLLIGIFICSLFFLKKKVVVVEKPAEPTQTASAHQLKHKIKTPDNKKPHTETAEQYDFYTMLPKMQSNQTEAPPAAPPPHPTKPLALAEQSMLSPETKPETVATPAPINTEHTQTAASPVVQKNTVASPTNTETVTPSPSKKYIVVSGDFDHYEAADAKKAELVLAGITHAKVESYSSNGTTHYRLNLGSYANKTHANKIVAQLQAAQLSGTIIEPS